MWPDTAKTRKPRPHMLRGIDVLLRGGLEPLAAHVAAPELVSDPDRREELVRRCLADLGRRESAWFAETGWELGWEEWHDHGRRSLGMYVSDLSEAFYVCVHAGDWDMPLTLPAEPWASGVCAGQNAGGVPQMRWM